MQDGIRGYNTDAARGADTFVPFSSKFLAGNAIFLGTLSSGSFSKNLSGYKGFDKLTADNFIVDIKSAPQISCKNSASSGNYGTNGGFTISKSYNKNTGILSVSGARSYVTLTNLASTQSDGSYRNYQYFSGNVYLIGEINPL